MKTIQELVADRAAALKKRLGEVADEAHGMIRAVRRKLDTLERKLKADPGGAFTSADAGVEEALTLAFRLSRLAGIAIEATTLAELEKAAAKVEAVAPVVSKPEAGEIPGMEDDGKGEADDE